MRGGPPNATERFTVSEDIRTAVEGDDEDDGKGRGDPFEHKLIRALLPEYLKEVEKAAVRKAELEAHVKAATAKDEEEDGDEAEPAEVVSDDELKKTKKELAAAKRKLKELEKELLRRLDAALTKLDKDGRRELVLGLWRESLVAHLDRYVTAHRQRIVDFVDSLWDKYRVAMAQVEGDRSEATARLANFLKALGYAK